VIDGKRLRISEYKQLLKAKKLADCGGGGGVAGRTSRHHQLWRDATSAGAKGPMSSRPGSGGQQQYLADMSLNGSTPSGNAAAAAAGPFAFSSHHCSPCSASSDSAYGTTHRRCRHYLRRGAGCVFVGICLFVSRITQNYTPPISAKIR